MRTFTPRPPSLGALAALDFGLRVRVEARAKQRTIFSGSENLSLQELTSELSEMVAELRVHSFVLRGRFETVTSALMLNVQSGFWPQAERAALDLAGLLGYARQRRFADAELCVRGEACAVRIAQLCRKEVR